MPQVCSVCPSPQVRLSPLLFLENTEIAASPLAETKDFAAEDTVESSSPVGSRQCFLYPGPGGGYGFKLCCVASRPCLFISQVTDAPCALEPFHHLSTCLPLPACMPSLGTPDECFHVFPPMLPGNPRRLSCPCGASNGRCSFGSEWISCGWRQRPE